MCEEKKQRNNEGEIWDEREKGSSLDNLYLGSPCFVGARKLIDVLIIDTYIEFLFK